MSVVPPPTGTPEVIITPTSFQQGQAVNIAWSLTGFPASETFGVFISGQTSGTFGTTDANGDASGIYPASVVASLPPGTYDFTCSDSNDNIAIALLTVTPPPGVGSLGTLSSNDALALGGVVGIFLLAWGGYRLSNRKRRRR